MKNDFLKDEVPHYKCIMHNFCVDIYIQQKLEKIKRKHGNIKVILKDFKMVS